MHCKPNVLPAVVHPTKCCVNQTFQNNIVPHIHPTHTTTVNHVNFQHQHFFPQTQSTVNEVTHQNFVAPPGPVTTVPFGGPGAQFGGPGASFGGPGFGAGPFGPGPFGR